MIRARAKALNGAGWISLFQGDYERAKALLEEGLVLYRDLEDKDGLASCLAPLGFALMLGQRDLASVPALLEEAMRIRPELEDARTIANLLIFAGLVAAGGGESGRAMALLEEGLEIFREVRDTLGVSMCLTVMGLVETGWANHVRASGLTRENLRLAREANDKVSIHFSLVTLASVALGLGEPARASRLWGMAEATREAFGIHLTPMTHVLINYKSLLADSRARLGDAAFERAWNEGKAMKGARAIEYALAGEGSSPASKEAPAGTKEDTLSPREQEVAALVARGLTNRRISEELHVSERTVTTHVGRILKKLDLASREQVAERVAR